MKTHLVTAVLLGTVPLGLAAQSGSQPTITVYGSAMLDAGHNADQIDPNWHDAIRTTTLPSFTNHYPASRPAA